MLFCKFKSKHILERIFTISIIPPIVISYAPTVEAESFFLSSITYRCDVFKQLPKYTQILITKYFATFLNRWATFDPDQNVCVNKYFTIIQITMSSIFLTFSEVIFLFLFYVRFTSSSDPAGLPPAVIVY